MFAKAKKITSRPERPGGDGREEKEVFEWFFESL
tara:strand:- start:411 stop:512 length:102 start_codon:yes stop_codon:yes gene_type:complete